MYEAVMKLSSERAGLFLDPWRCRLCRECTVRYTVVYRIDHNMLG